MTNIADIVIDGHANQCVCEDCKFLRIVVATCRIKDGTAIQDIIKAMSK